MALHKSMREKSYCSPNGFIQSVTRRSTVFAFQDERIVRIVEHYWAKEE
jgi:hypothetical protein